MTKIRIFHCNSEEASDDVTASHVYCVRVTNEVTCYLLITLQSFAVRASRQVIKAFHVARKQIRVYGSSN
jgi:hypothetical protein